MFLGTGCISCCILCEEGKELFHAWFGDPEEQVQVRKRVQILIGACLCFKREHVGCEEAILLIFWEVDTIAVRGDVQDVPQDGEDQICQEIDTQHQQEEPDNPYLHYGRECICTSHTFSPPQQQLTTWPATMLIKLKL